MAVWLQQPEAILLRRTTMEWIDKLGMSVSCDTRNRIATRCCFANNAVVHATARALQHLLPGGIAVVHVPQRRVMLYRGRDAVRELTLLQLRQSCAGRRRPLTLLYTSGHVDLLLSSLDGHLAGARQVVAWAGWPFEDVSVPPDAAITSGVSLDAGMRRARPTVSWHVAVQLLTRSWMK